MGAMGGMGPMGWYIRAMCGAMGADMGAYTRGFMSATGGGMAGNIGDRMWDTSNNTHVANENEK
jgi:hypothetical protein